MLHAFILFQFSVDVTFPHFHKVVTLAFQVLDVCHGAVVKFLHGFTVDQIHGITGVTSRTSVPKTEVDFERGMRFFMVAVEQIVRISRYCCVRVGYRFRCYRPSTTTICAQTPTDCSWGYIPSVE